MIPHEYTLGYELLLLSKPLESLWKYTSEWVKWLIVLCHNHAAVHFSFFLSCISLCPLSMCACLTSVHMFMGAHSREGCLMFCSITFHIISMMQDPSLGLDFSCQPVGLTDPLLCSKEEGCCRFKWKSLSLHRKHFYTATSSAPTFQFLFKLFPDVLAQNDFYIIISTE